MPEPTFRGDPYRVLDVSRDASIDAIKRRWRELAREHHPDRAAGAPAEAEQMTSRMARINAAYDLLRDPIRRARYDASPQARRARETDTAGYGVAGTETSGRWDRAEGFDAYRQAPTGPPPPPPTRPVTARFDTSAAYHRRNATISSGGSWLRGQPPIDRRTRHPTPDDRRASTPTGPVRRRHGTRSRMPSLEEARATSLEFGRFQGFTLGQVAGVEPTYIDWIARTITRDGDLVARARGDSGRPGRTWDRAPDQTATTGVREPGGRRVVARPSRFDAAGRHLSVAAGN